MSDSTLEEELPRWILDEPTDADLAPGGGLEDCDGVALAPPEEGDGDDQLPPGIVVGQDGMDGVDLPDNLAAVEDYGDGGYVHDDDGEDPDDG